MIMPDGERVKFWQVRFTAEKGVAENFAEITFMLQAVQVLLQPVLFYPLGFETKFRCYKKAQLSNASWAYKISR